ncbi:DUF4097 family beta strand repeat-containing protein [Saccharothrix variisporea]|uniref:DUF4097 family beta strand repeat-containing protein n=1 Tax=Saccharothrix variisporea TaxID=543527 RepID=UPI0011C346EC|nr:DUF4097 family beta strand repeat-containing protein [Saccharothrix variisporea]
MVKRVVWAVVGVVALVGALAGCVRLVQEKFSDQGRVTEKVVAVRVQNDSGRVTVRGSDAATSVEVKRTVEYPRNTDKPSGTTYRVDGDTLVLDDCGRNCSVDYDVTVPGKDVKVVGGNGSGDVTFERVGSVDIEVGSGDVHVRDVSGSVKVENGSGDVDVSDVGGSFKGNVGSGRAKLTDMRGEVSVVDSSGDVEVGMAAVQPVRAESGSGKVEVRLPKGVYRVEAESGSGERSVGVATDPAAKVSVVVKSGSGDVSVQPAL